MVSARGPASTYSVQTWSRQKQGSRHARVSVELFFVNYTGTGDLVGRAVSGA